MSPSTPPQVTSQTRSSCTPSVPISPVTPTAAAPVTPTDLPPNMSEKEERRKSFVGGKRFRITALLPLICSAAAFALILAIVIAGTKQGKVAGACEVMSLNMSTLGQNVIKFTPATATSSGAAATATAQNGIEQGLTDIGDFFGSIFQNITAGIDTGLNDAEAKLVDELTNKLGIQDSYTFYLMQMCSGTTENRTSAGCTTYDSLASGLSNITNVVPSSFQIATTNVSIPILAGVSAAGGYIQTISSALTTTVFAFYVLSLVTSMLVVVLSAILIFFSGAKFAKLLIYFTLVFAGMNTVFTLIASIGVSVIVSLAMTVVNAVGNDLGVYGSTGTTFLVLTWVGWVLILIASLYWAMVWFVELRTYAVKARYRTSQEIGDYRGVFSEVVDDLRRPKNERVSVSQEHAESLVNSRRNSRRRSRNLEEGAATEQRWV